MSFPKTRLRRLRHHHAIRNLVRETHLNLDKMVLPLFVRHGQGIKNPVLSMPGHFQFSVDQLEDEIKTINRLGIKQVLLFGIPSEKDAHGSDSYSDNGIIQTAIRAIKQWSPNLVVITDVCLCEYTHHGHCGVVSGENIDNDATLPLLAKQAVSHAQAGADIIAPSANMDGMVGAIRSALDQASFQNVPILSYAVKYASAMYSPFRQAAEGAPQFGDRSTYQMDIGNVLEAVRECELDVQEGADMLMVKPAHTYLDVISLVKDNFPGMPLCAYHTSGEYAMLQAAIEKGWIDQQKGITEVLTAIHRAGADMIISYFTKQMAEWL